MSVSTGDQLVMAGEIIKQIMRPDVDAFIEQIRIVNVVIDQETNIVKFIGDKNLVCHHVSLYFLFDMNDFISDDKGGGWFSVKDIYGITRIVKIQYKATRTLTDIHKSIVEMKERANKNDKVNNLVKFLDMVNQPGYDMTVQNKKVGGYDGGKFEVSNLRHKDGVYDFYRGDNWISSLTRDQLLTAKKSADGKSLVITHMILSDTYELTITLWKIEKTIKKEVIEKEVVTKTEVALPNNI